MYSVEVGSRHPFKSNLIDSGFRAGKIFLLESDPQRVIREQRVRGDAFDKDRYLIAKALFTELQQSYGIYVPDIHIILGASTRSAQSRSKSLYVVTNMVHGKNLSHPDVFAGCDLAALTPKLDRFYTSLAQYYQDKRLNGEKFLSDLSASQFVYGRRQNETEDQIYLVDLDPFFARLDERGFDFFSHISGLCYMVLHTEAQLKGRKLESARVRLLMISKSDEVRTDGDITGSNGYRNDLMKQFQQRSRKWLERLVYRLIDS